MFPELYSWGLFTLHVPGTSRDQTVFVRVDMLTFQGGQKPFRETRHPDLPWAKLCSPAGDKEGGGA